MPAELYSKPVAVNALSESDGSASDTQADAELVDAARTGALEQRHRAFTMLVVRYEGFVRAMLYALCGNRAHADELSQEAFVTAWQKLPSLQQPQRFRGWLKQLAYRQFLHHYRRTQLERRSADQLPMTSMQSAVSACDLQADPGRDLAAMLALCSDLEQELMVLSYAFEFTYEEIATARQMPVGTVKSHVHRAKHKIRQHLQETADDAAGLGTTIGNDHHE